MLKDLIKIANRLDSLGLTKEADVIDRFLNKTARAFGFMTQLPAGMEYSEIEEVRAAVYQDQNVRNFFKSLDVSYRHNLPSSNYRTIDPDIAKKIYAAIRFINSPKWQERDLTWWFQDEHVQIPTGKYLKHYLDEWLTDAVENLLDAMKHNRNWRQDPEFFEMAKFLHIGGEAEKAVRKIGGEARGLGVGVSTSTPAAAAPSTARVETPPATPKAPAETKPAETKPAETKPAETKPAEDPWIAYSRRVRDTNMSIKNKWIERAKATGKSSTYQNYQAWLSSRAKSSGPLSVSDVIMRLDAEIKGAGFKKEIAERGTMTFTEARPGQQYSTSPGRGDDLIERREFDRLENEN